MREEGEEGSIKHICRKKQQPKLLQIRIWHTTYERSHDCGRIPIGGIGGFGLENDGHRPPIPRAYLPLGLLGALYVGCVDGN
jgi:hypothetical protein